MPHYTSNIVNLPVGVIDTGLIPWHPTLGFRPVYISVWFFSEAGGGGKRGQRILATVNYNPDPFGAVDVRLAHIDAFQHPHFFVTVSGNDDARSFGYQVNVGDPPAAPVRFWNLSESAGYGLNNPDITLTGPTDANLAIWFYEKPLETPSSSTPPDGQRGRRLLITREIS